MDQVEVVISIIAGIIVLVILIIFLLIRFCVCCCRCLFGSSHRGADHGLHSATPGGTTYVILNQNQPYPGVHNVSPAPADHRIPLPPGV